MKVQRQISWESWVSCSKWCKQREKAWDWSWWSTVPRGGGGGQGGGSGAFLRTGSTLGSVLPSCWWRREKQEHKAYPRHTQMWSTVCPLPFFIYRSRHSVVMLMTSTADWRTWPKNTALNIIMTMKMALQSVMKLFSVSSWGTVVQTKKIIPEEWGTLEKWPFTYLFIKSSRMTG